MTPDGSLTLFALKDVAAPTDRDSSDSSDEVERPESAERVIQLRLSISVESLVEDFHLAFGLPIASRPTTDVPVALSDLRKRLLAEEAAELFEAIDEGDIEHIAAELADVLYVVYGTALTYGIPLDAAVEEIHRSNMSKLDERNNPIMRHDGKVLKGQRYTPPDLHRVLGE